MTQSVRVFDPPMCCPTGICGPAVDPALVRFAADLEWLRSQGVSVERFNLTSSPAAFAGNLAVRALLQEKGDDVLPVIMVGDAVVSTGRYPNRAELAGLTGLEPPPVSLMTDAISELVAIGASIASNCEPCFRFHFDKARRLGVSREDMLWAVRVAQAVKETPARSVLALAERYLMAGGTEKAAGSGEAKAEAAFWSLPGAVSIRAGQGKADPQQE